MNLPGVQMKRLLLLALVVIVLIASPAFAFTLTADSTEATVNAGETYAFDFTVYSEREDRFFIHMNGLYPWMTIEDIGKVAAGKQKSFKLYVSPFYYTGTGTYQINVEVQSEATDERQEKSIFVTILKKIYTGIEEIYVSGNLEPMGYVDIKIALKNSGAVPMQNVDVYFLVKSPSREIARFNETLRAVDPLETTYVEKIVELDPLAEYGEYTVEARVFYKGELFSQKNQKFDVMAIPLVYEEEREENGIFAKSITIRAINYGNDDAFNVVVNRTISNFDSKFFHEVLGPYALYRGNEVFWTISSISPGEAATIIYQINYIPLYMILFVVAAASWFVLYRVRIVDIRKDIIKKSENEIVVKLEVKNRTGHEIDAVILKDTVPLIFHVKSFVGLKPVKKRTEDGSEIVWRIRKLNLDEERVFSYAIMPVIGVVGDIKMPRAKILYKKNDKIHAKTSNSPVIR